MFTSIPTHHSLNSCLACSDERAQRGSTAVLANAEDGHWTDGREDSDAAASIEVPIHDCKKPTCMHVDEIAGKYPTLLNTVFCYRSDNVATLL